MPHLISIVGPTGVGKTQLSVQLAQHYQTEILSGDSRQMYRKMDIGTAKPTIEERSGIPHHFLDTLDPDQSYSPGQFERDASELLEQLFRTHEVAIMVGGSTLYMESFWYQMNEMPEVPAEVREKLNQEFKESGLGELLEELMRVDPFTYEVVDRANPARIIRALEVYRASGTPISTFRTGRKPKVRPYKIHKIGLTDNRDLLYNRINLRVDQMIESGLEAEVRNLWDAGYQEEDPGIKSIGYQEWYPYFREEYDREEAIRLIKRNSRRYAKRQLTFYRRHEDIEWFQAGQWDTVREWLSEQI
ncbi:tRNA (adenosine(37)-N6)-dimethylallyltransferase MiaA [Pontibacter sp. G13]|uniref:tRNA (adenosine(37)-N6)-dimethylallyltransferase MiaA n=1 Tax=Pontibacter sp. G13 TaxID=3074898 RepID=UPI00288A951D|nr:tRNA (adenosine(37)-N6)-dimethylallyltransferase MiaA [Pontibacter sp. G13]WNJ19813.1 tRNA (adenosine(37)-N6)-dimethylallyltransferase MiaA [Pontibacter sp. G13]